MTDRAEELGKAVSDAIMCADPNPYNPADQPYYDTMAAAALEAILDWFEKNDIGEGDEKASLRHRNNN